MSELLPCPFCGGTDGLFVHIGPELMAAWQCNTCRCQGPDVKVSIKYRTGEYHAGAIKAWNTRSNPKDKGDALL